MKFILLLMLFVMGGLQAQTDFESIEQQILDTYQILKTAHLEQNPERQGIFSAKLKNQLMFALLQDGSYYYPFLRLRQYIKVVESSDKKVRVFSWDALGLDASRRVCSLAQYRGVQNEAYFYVLSDGSQSAADYRAVFINKIHLLNSPTGMPYYLLLGNGSHGIGQEHTTLRIFYFGHNQLLECKDCLEGNLPYWTVNGSTQFPVELSYHPRRKKLYYYQPTYDPKTGKRLRGLHYQLYWKDGFFRAY